MARLEAGTDLLAGRHALLLLLHHVDHAGAGLLLLLQHLPEAGLHLLARARHHLLPLLLLHPRHRAPRLHRHVLGGLLLLADHVLLPAHHHPLHLALALHDAAPRPHHLLRLAGHHVGHVARPRPRQPHAGARRPGLLLHVALLLLLDDGADSLHEAHLVVRDEAEVSLLLVAVEEDQNLDVALASEVDTPSKPCDQTCKQCLTMFDDGTFNTHRVT